MSKFIFNTSTKLSKDSLLNKFNIYYFLNTFKNKFKKMILENKDISELPKIEFIDYTGEYPCLCNGTLTIKVNNKEYQINHLCSGGNVWFDDNWEPHIESGPWTIDGDDIPEEIRKYKDEILEVVNKNISLGCCGGCI